MSKMPKPLPHTTRSIEHDLRSLGLAAGDTVLVHTSLKQVGYTVGGPQAVVQALLNIVSKKGTIVMPTFTNGAGYADPLDWTSPPVPVEWAEHVRSNLPSFDPSITPSVDMGIVAELFRTWPGVRRNHHPIVSYAAWGKHADFIVNGHSLEMMDGENSPLARIYDLDGKILLLGVDYNSCTSIHLAAHRQDDPPMTTVSIPTWDEAGQVQWNRYPDVVNPVDAMDPAVITRMKLWFSDIGAAFEARFDVPIGQVGDAESRLIEQRLLVDFAASYFNDRPYGEATRDKGPGA